MRKTLLFATLLAAGGAAAESGVDALKRQLQSELPDADIQSVKPTPLPDIYQIVTGSEVLYMSRDGRYLIQGDLIDRRKSVNLTERARREQRRAQLAGISDSETVMFPAEEERFTINVFTDTTCGFCRKLHQEVPALNQQGVTVRYLAYPRRGPGSGAAQSLENVWCAEDRRAAMNTAKTGGQLERRQCDVPIREQMQLGREMGLRGTPYIVTADGTAINGYRPADQIVKMLESGH